ncbi:hypothetical protein C2R22_03065 [Salinigranum rubrum]|uniref:Uncharacterized protein n=2 Tax=Salinigranum rubrum TaxID=755307 RepID=A0A2I8VFQ0_9EURY|nr:hypothetical protein C2R22_03065 [Salinigranum rubrum]
MNPEKPLRRRRLVSARAIGAFVGCLLALVGLARPALAHAGSLSGSLQSAQAPFWLVVVTGGGVVAASFLFATFVTDHEVIREVNDRRLRLPVGGVRPLVPVVRALGVLGLLAVLVVGVVGPRDPLLNLAVLTVWVGWWAGYTMSTYLLADSWPLVNPWLTLSSLVERVRGRVGTDRARTLPEALGVWPSVAGLLGLVWLEVVSPVGERPSTLVAVVAGYTLVTLAGAAVYGRVWFDRVDPVARVFRLYGLVAPIRRGDPIIEPPEAARGRPQTAHDGGVALPDERDGERAEGDREGTEPGETEGTAAVRRSTTTAEERTGAAATLTLPGTALVRYPRAMGRDDVAFVVALLWATTYDGLVSTPAWNGVVRALALVVPPLLTHLVTAVVGFGLFLLVYHASTRFVGETAETYVTTRFVAGWFAPALVPIAAGYHVAHFLGYFLSLAPALGTLALSPLSAPTSVPLLSLPAWFGSLQLGFVVAGHLLAVWVAHARAFELFPGRLQPIRSQYPFVVVMIVYTMTSLWIVAQPFAAPVT